MQCVHVFVCVYMYIYYGGHNQHTRWNLGALGPSLSSKRELGPSLLHYLSHCQCCNRQCYFQILIFMLVILWKTYSFSFRMCYVFAVHSDNELDGSKLAQLHHLLFVAVLTFVYCWPPFWLYSEVIRPRPLRPSTSWSTLWHDVIGVSCHTWTGIGLRREFGDISCTECTVQGMTLSWFQW